MQSRYCYLRYVLTATLCNRAPSSRQATSACRFLLAPRRSDSSAHPQHPQCCRAPLIHRRARLSYRPVRPHSFTTYALVAGRPPSVATRSPKTTINTATIVRPLFAVYSWALLVTFVCSLYAAIVAENKAADLHPYAIAHSLPARAEHHPTLVNSAVHS